MEQKGNKFLIKKTNSRIMGLEVLDFEWKGVRVASANLWERKMYVYIMFRDSFLDVMIDFEDSKEGIKEATKVIMKRIIWNNGNKN